MDTSSNQLPEPYSRTQHDIRVVICDLDNAHWDLCAHWAAAISAQLHFITQRTGIPLDTLHAEFQQLHQSVGSIECTFRTANSASVRKWIYAQDQLTRQEKAAALIDFSKKADDVYDAIFRRVSRMYDRSWEALKQMRDQGVILIGLSDGPKYPVLQRLIRYHLDGIFHEVYTQDDHCSRNGRAYLPEPKKLLYDQISQSFHMLKNMVHFPGQAWPFFHKEKTLERELIRNEMRRHSDDRYDLQHTQHYITPYFKHKPDMRPLLEIAAKYGALPHQVLCYGDSFNKDIVPGFTLGMATAFPEYGMPGHGDDVFQQFIFDSIKLMNGQKVEPMPDYYKTADAKEQGATFTLKHSFHELVENPDITFSAPDPAQREEAVKTANALLKHVKTLMDQYDAQHIAQKTRGR